MSLREQECNSIMKEEFCYIGEGIIINEYIIKCVIDLCFLIFVINYIENGDIGEARCVEYRFCPANKECLRTPTGVYCCCQTDHCNTRILPQNNVNTRFTLNNVLVYFVSAIILIFVQFMYLLN